MKNLFIAFFIVSLVAVVSCKSNASRNDTHSPENESVAQVEYTCSMHPEVVSEKPGKCPKCGMELIQKESNADTTDMNQQKDTTMQHMH